MDMANHDISFLTRITELFASAFRREVKTPLSFFFRVVGAIAVFVVVGLFTLSHSGDGDTRRLELFYAALAMLGVMFLVVCLFAWFKPKNLVYGEAGHRAELKMQFGTEKSILTADQAAALPGVLNLPQQLGEGSDQG